MASEEDYDSSEYCTATSEDESDEETNVQYVTPRIFVNESAEKETAKISRLQNSYGKETWII